MIYGIMAGKYKYKDIDLNDLIDGFTGNVWDKTSSSDNVIGYLKPYSFGYFHDSVDLSTKYTAPVSIFSADTYVSSSNIITYNSMTNKSVSCYSGYNVILMGGGGGGGSDNTGGSGGGGGAGGFFMAKNVKIQDYTLYIGAGGGGAGSSNEYGYTGGNTYITANSKTFMAYGGSGGASASSGHGGGLYGIYTNNTIDSNNNSTTVDDLNVNSISNGSTGSNGYTPYGGVGTNVYIPGGIENQRGRGGNGGTYRSNGGTGTNGIAYFLFVKV